MFSTHHTDVALLYTITGMVFLFMAGVLAMMIRTHLFFPGQAVLISDPATFNRLFTLHGLTVLFLFALPVAAGIGNYLVPIMVRYKDMAYPKLIAVAVWMNPVGGAVLWLGFPAA